jgi:hypothetical protein
VLLRADESDVVVEKELGEVTVLGQKTITRVYSLCPGIQACLQNVSLHQVRLGTGSRSLQNKGKGVK